MSDHYPILTDDQDNIYKSCWFHTDPALFKLPIVQEEVQYIWSSLFNKNLLPAKEWTLATKSTQNLLKQVRKEVTTQRQSRLKNLQNQLEEQEAATNHNTINQIRAKLRREEQIALKHTKLFTREWWAGKIDRPCPEMFKMLKVKKDKNTYLYSVI